MAAAPCSRIADCPPGAASAGDKADAGTRTGRFQHPADHEYGPGRRSQIAPGNAQRRAERVLCSPASRPAPCRCGVLASGRDGSQRACRAHREAASKGQRDQRQHNGSQHAERAPVSFGSHTVRAPLLRYRQAPTGLADGLAVSITHAWRVCSALRMLWAGCPHPIRPRPARPGWLADIGSPARPRTERRRFGRSIYDVRQVCISERVRV